MTYDLFSPILWHIGQHSHMIIHCHTRNHLFTSMVRRDRPDNYLSGQCSLVKIISIAGRTKPWQCHIIMSLWSILTVHMHSASYSQVVPSTKHITFVMSLFFPLPGLAPTMEHPTHCILLQRAVLQCSRHFHKVISHFIMVIVSR